MTDGRPDPDRLLAAVNRGRARHRGRLKVFLGASAGVGKTYSMLSAAHEASRAGQEVVAAVVETHGRAETLAQLDGIEVLPRRRVDGYVDGELDLDATLARRADVSIVDELAHTNAPGSRHPKRWQDVLELVDAGLEVWTAVNVQHLESVNDVVARLTGVVVKETVPDHVLDHADEVEVVDLPPSELIERLEAGKVYGHGQAQRALKAFFREGNLLALRQIALRRAAERVGAQLDDWRDAEAMPEVWSGGERLLVAVGPSPLSGQLVRVAARLARQLDAGWHAVTVRPPARDDASTRRALEQLSLAESLGASTAVLTSDDVAAELVTYARRVNATTLVLGASAPRWLERSLVDRVTRLARDIHVHVVPAPHATRSTPPDREVSWPERVAPRELVLGVGGVERVA
ncbi:MAG: universal stress protein, partial [Myxococcota bacterium]